MMISSKYFTLKNYINFVAYHLRAKYKKSYAQCGEDIIIDAFLTGLGITQPTYIDIGTYHPILNNNTYLFYTKGGHGICIEPDDVFYKLIQRNRTRDICLNAGAGPVEKSAADFYKMSSHNLNTFSKVEAEETATKKHYGDQKIKEVVQIPLVTVTNLVKNYLHNQAPDILSIDAEGLDFDIVNSIDFSVHRPKVICTETLRYNKDGKLEKEKDVENYLATKGYVLYADTYVNSIFVDKNLVR
jgi:FkbM family methyltransferase